MTFDIALVINFYTPSLIALRLVTNGAYYARKRTVPADVNLNTAKQFSGYP
jgi:hypothetical protein